MVSVKPFMDWSDMGNPAAKEQIVAMVRQLSASGSEQPDQSLQTICETIKARPLTRHGKRVFSTAVVLSDGQVLPPL